MDRDVRATILIARAIAVALKLTAVTSLTASQMVAAAYAQVDLPSPYVSKALDAVLIPINHASRHRYQIPPRLHGVYVLAVAPHGIAASQGIRPGDVLATIRNHPILVPADVDRLVWALLAVRVTDFLFDVSRGPDIVRIDTNITINNFNDNIAINTINNWTSVDDRQDWTQIVDEYNIDLSTSLTDDSYREDAETSGTDDPASDKSLVGSDNNDVSGASDVTDDQAGSGNDIGGGNDDTPGNDTVSGGDDDSGSDTSDSGDGDDTQSQDGQ